MTHAEVFEDKSHLPTLSSAAIETNLHRIPGLSEHFLYMNDDFFLGKPILPEDFISTKGYKVFWGKTCNTEFANGGLDMPGRKLLVSIRFLNL